MVFGFHVSKNGRPMHVALAEDMKILQDYGMKPCAQVFVSGPRTFKETLNDEEKARVREYIAETGAQIVIHGAYVDNPWNKSPGSVHNIKQELRICSQIGATGVIVHLGNKTFDTLQYVIEEVTDIEQRDVTLWLEIHAAKPNPGTFETPEKITKLFNLIKNYNTHGVRIGLCIDTAHLFACGTSLSEYNAAKQWIAGLPDVPLMLHLNDSKSIFKSGKDQHARLLYGNIWKKYNPDSGEFPISQSGLAYLLEYAEENNIMVILERDEESLPYDIDLIHKLGYFHV